MKFHEFHTVIFMTGTQHAVVEIYEYFIMHAAKAYKGQLISKYVYEIIVWTKIPTKILIVSALALSGQKLSNFLLVFWSKRRLQKDILKLTDL